ncbi:MAG TPA: sulfatase-like hydrolase/transferase [Opitutaceae bacterium]|nr:sulfatase-like hydrolase/transferase [Opitutaceae bacterium]
MPPNILWIATTQWRAQACGYSGDPNALTPCLDALAAESVNFSQAVTPHPFGPFARAAMLTGVASPENGIRDYFDPLPPGARTIAHEMRDRSYSTAFFGKWHLYRRDKRARLTGDEHARIVVPAEYRGGFDFWEGFESGFLLNNPWLHGSRLPRPARFCGYQSDVVCERASEMLRGLGGAWFAVVSLEAPHPPYTEPAAGIPARDPATLALRGNVPADGRAAERARRELAGYYAHIEATDRSLGRLLCSLPRDTRVVLTSVHGDMHGSHGLFRKGWPHEESIRVPMLVRVPGAARLDDGPISLLELARMTADLASGAEALPAAGARGEGGGSSRISMPSVVALADQCDRAWAGVRTGTRKLVLDALGAPWLFYDLEKDPLELRNLAADPARAAEIAGLRRVILQPEGPKVTR